MGVSAARRWRFSGLGHRGSQTTTTPPGATTRYASSLARATSAALASDERVRSSVTAPNDASANGRARASATRMSAPPARSRARATRSDRMSTPCRRSAKSQPRADARATIPSHSPRRGPPRERRAGPASSQIRLTTSRRISWLPGFVACQARCRLALRAYAPNTRCTRRRSGSSTARAARPWRP